MIRHIVLINLKADASAEDQQRLLSSVRELPDEIPWIRAWEVGAGVNPGGATLGIVGLFDDNEAFAKYMADPAHKRCAQTYIVPVMESGTQIQFEVPGPPVTER